MKKSKQIILGLACVFAVFALIPIVSAVLYVNFPQEVTDVEEVKYLMPCFEDVPVVSADCEWCVEAGTVGFVTESSLSGKLIVSEEYCDYLIKNFQWRESKGSPYHDVNVSDEMEKFLSNNKYLVSDEYFQKMSQGYSEHFDLYFAPDENAVYFYYYNF